MWLADGWHKGRCLNFSKYNENGKTERQLMKEDNERKFIERLLPIYERFLMKEPVEKLAKEYGCSRTHLYSKFKKLQKITP
jgi:AraC-like DNA-binding protein